MPKSVSDLPIWNYDGSSCYQVSLLSLLLCISFSVTFSIKNFLIWQCCILLAFSVSASHFIELLGGGKQFGHLSPPCEDVQGSIQGWPQYHGRSKHRRHSSKCNHRWCAKRTSTTRSQRRQTTGKPATRCAAHQRNFLKIINKTSYCKQLPIIHLAKANQRQRRLKLGHFECNMFMEAANVDKDAKYLVHTQCSLERVRKNFWPSPQCLLCIKDNDFETWHTYGR